MVWAGRGRPGNSLASSEFGRTDCPSLEMTCGRDRAAGSNRYPIVNSFCLESPCQWSSVGCAVAKESVGPQESDEINELWSVQAMWMKNLKKTVAAGPWATAFR